jgi:hypothetical protein
MPREGEGGTGKSAVELQPTDITVKTGTDPDGNYVVALDFDSKVARYRYVLPYMTFLEYVANTVQALADSIREQRKGN